VREPKTRRLRWRGLVREMDPDVLAMLDGDEEEVGAVQSANLQLKSEVKSQQLLWQAFAALLDTWLCEVSLEKEGKYDFEVKEAGAEHGHGSQHTHIFHEVVAALAEEDKLTQDDRDFWKYVHRALTFALEAEDKLKQDEMGFWNDVYKIPMTSDPLHEIRDISYRATRLACTIKKRYDTAIVTLGERIWRRERQDSYSRTIASRAAHEADGDDA
jgi:hypothetical protein